MEEYSLTKRIEDNLIILQPRGILDQDAGESFKESVLELLIHERKNIIVSLQDVNFIFSFALGVLVACLQEAAKRGRKFILCEAPSSINRVLVQVSFHEIFEIHSTLEQARESLR